MVLWSFVPYNTQSGNLGDSLPYLNVVVTPETLERVLIETEFILTNLSKKQHSDVIWNLTCSSWNEPPQGKLWSRTPEAAVTSCPQCCGISGSLAGAQSH